MTTESDILNRGQSQPDACTIGDFSCYLDWLLDQFASLFLWVWDRILSAMASLIESIPLPDWVHNVGSLQIPDIVGWFIEPFQPQLGITIIISAYTLRFLIRRLPVVG